MLLTLIPINITKEEMFKIKKKLFLITFILFLILLSADPILAQSNLNFQATINENLQYINVTVEVTDIEASRDKLFFSLPQLFGFFENKDQFNYLDYVHNLKAYDQKGELDITKKDNFLEIELNSDQLFLEYEVDKQIYFPEPFVPDQLLAIIYTTDTYAYFDSKYIFLIPDRIEETESINVTFDIPDGWKVFAPFKKINNHYSVKDNKVISHLSHFKRSSFYMGEAEFIVEKSENNTTHQIARLKGDKNQYSLNNKTEAQNFMNKVTKVYNYYVEIFEINPYPSDLWLPMTRDYIDGKQLSSASNNTGTGWHYWPDDREFEITCHVVQSFMGGGKNLPLFAETAIFKGIGEYYFGHLAAYEIFNKDLELGKMYYTYLVYERILENDVSDHYEYEFMKGYTLAVYLDNRIQEISYDNYSLKDVIRKLSNKYALENHKITFQNLQDAVFELTGNRMESEFDKYVYGEQKIPAYQYLKEYKDEFEELDKTLDDSFGTELGGHVTPLFINIELTLHNNQHIMSGIYMPIYLEQFQKEVKNNYNIDQLTKADVEEILTELAGADCTGFFDRWQSSYGELSLQELKDWLSYRNNI